MTVRTELTAIKLAPIAEGSPRSYLALAARLSLLLRSNGRVRHEIGMTLKDTPRTAKQVLEWGKDWCHRHEASVYVLVTGGDVVGMMTERADGTEVLTLLSHRRFSR